MKDFFHYLTTSEEDENWGITLNVSGKAESAPLTTYPSPKHPSGYYFTWNSGRVLNEYQINYITQGSGVFETKDGAFELNTGSVFIIFPGVWHRYRPDFQKGWTENYIGFSGPIIEQLFNKSIFSAKKPVINIGVREEIIDTYYKIFELTLIEKPGFKHIASGMIVKLLGYLISYEKQKDFSGKEVSKIIEAVRFKIRQELNQNIDFRELSSVHHISYSYLRKMFKKYTGISPGQYQLQLRIMHAKELIISTEKSIKDICYETGFQSIHHFSHLFKQKTGISPSEFRKKQFHT
ncbi:MAG: AraC family transcriptional regulator [Prolixibacteraceae bacterium]|nr:AraC family transcriptional regulator [Prolixibacteraceae bacterium]